MKIDINCDMGESFGRFIVGNDREMMPYISSANIACGFHAGDPAVMKETVKLAKEYNVQIGAHPGFPDLLGFGRRRMLCTKNEIRDYVTYQLGALKEFALHHDVKVEHVKPHGALYMTAMEDEEIAKGILESIAHVNEEMIVYSLKDSALYDQGVKMGIRVAIEAYADCEHTNSGSIIQIKKSTSIEDIDGQVNRVIRMIKKNEVISAEGDLINIYPQTICIHGDTEGAPNFVKKLFIALKDNDITLTASKNLV